MIFEFNEFNELNSLKWFFSLPAKIVIDCSLGSRATKKEERKCNFGRKLDSFYPKIKIMFTIYSEISYG